MCVCVCVCVYLCVCVCVCELCNGSVLDTAIVLESDVCSTQTRSPHNVAAHRWEDPKEKERAAGLLNYAEFVQVLGVVAEAIVYPDEPNASDAHKAVLLMRLVHAAAANPRNDSTLKQLQALAQPQVAALAPVFREFSSLSRFRIRISVNTVVRLQ
jgi:hypothetical protein